MTTPSWVNRLFQSIDALDTDAFVGFMTDDVVFRFANSDPVKGKTAVHGAVTAFFASIRSVRHEVLDTWVNPDAVICHGKVQYTRHDSSLLTVPFANIFKMQGDLIKEYLIYVDISELYATA
jgi:ketosteroid isomerase-like protein